MGSETHEKTRYSDSELAEFDALIIEKLAQAREQLEFYESQIQDIGNNQESKMKNIEDGAMNVETDQLYTMAERQRNLINHLENARMRIKNKVYGICRDTGKLIPKERLRAVPHATLSIDAKQKRK